MTPRNPVSNSSGSKNPYEVRLDVLKLAAEMLQAQTRTKEIVYQKNGDWNSIPTPYTVDELLLAANQLYGFVDNRSASSSFGSQVNTVTSLEGIHSQSVAVGVDNRGRGYQGQNTATKPAKG